MHAILFCLLALTGQQSDEQPTSKPVATAPLQGRIAFISNRAGNNDVYTMNPDGTDVRRVTKTGVDEDWPRWSPDGKLISFSRGEYPNLDIYVIEPDGSNERKLTKTGDASQACWSPDGKWLAMRREPNAHGDIWIMEVATGKLEQLTDDTAEEWGPDWAPDGKTIAYSNAGGREDIYTVDVKTKKQTKIFAERGEDSLPVYSPDGKWLICNPHPNRVATELVLCKPDGSGPRRLTFTTDEQRHAFNFGASFSPDSKHIVFTSGRDRNFEIYRMEIETGDLTRITDTIARDTRVHWGPASTTAAK